MTLLRKFLGDGGSAARSLLRALVVLATAFGLKLTVDQVGAVQLVLEAVLQAGQQIVKPTLPTDPPKGQ